jgi:hypothetical protein
MRDEDLMSTLFGLSDQVRYVAIGRGQQVSMRSRTGLAEASAEESDRYEELIVNPGLLTLVRQRGEIDCGGLDYVLIRYGAFFQLVVPIGEGHLSVSLEPDSSPTRLAEDVIELLRTSR